MRKSVIFGLLAASLTLAGCDASARVEESRKQAKRAEQIMNGKSNNAEADNIAKRLQTTTSPDLLGHVAIVNGVGNIVLYTTVKGKITSGSKRLTNPSFCGVNEGDCPSDEGTYGSSNPYVYFWTQNGAYIQTSMDYIYSDKPFRLEQKPILVGDAK